MIPQSQKPGVEGEPEKTDVLEEVACASEIGECFPFNTAQTCPGGPDTFLCRTYGPKTISIQDFIC